MWLGISPLPVECCNKFRACKLSLNIDKWRDTGNYCKVTKFISKLTRATVYLSVITGVSLEQAQVLSELFSGRAGLVASPAPCNMAQLQAYYSRSVMYINACSVSRTTEQA